MTNQLETAKEWLSDLNKIIDKTDNECTKQKRDVLEWLVESVEKLKDEKYQDPRQGMLEDLYVENQRYRVAIENIEQQIKKNDEQIEWLSKEHQSNYKSRQVEALYGEALGLEMGLWIINQALKGESQ